MAGRLDAHHLAEACFWVALAGAWGVEPSVGVSWWRGNATKNPAFRSSLELKSMWTNRGIRPTEKIDSPKTKNVVCCHPEITLVTRGAQGIGGATPAVGNLHRKCKSLSDRDRI
jgi:hypothetical protein